jgi:hypothetical protein
MERKAQTESASTRRPLVSQPYPAHHHCILHVLRRPRLTTHSSTSYTRRRAHLVASVPLSSHMQLNWVRETSASLHHLSVWQSDRACINHHVVTCTSWNRVRRSHKVDRPHVPPAS